MNDKFPSALPKRHRDENPPSKREKMRIAGAGQVRYCQMAMAMAAYYGMKRDLVSMDQAGRIVLPKEVRQELSIKPGDTLKITMEGPGVMLTPSKETTGFLRKGRALVFSTVGRETLSHATVEAILESGRAEHEARIVEGLGRRRGRG